MSVEDFQTMSEKTDNILSKQSDKILSSSEVFPMSDYIYFSKALLWYLTVRLGIPRTNSNLVQWQVGKTLNFISDSGKKLDWTQCDWDEGNWVFLPVSIKNQNLPHRSVWQQLTLAKELNKNIFFYLIYVRPHLVSSSGE